MNQSNLQSFEGTELASRQAKLKTLEAMQGCAYPNHFRRSHLATQVHRDYDHLEAAELEGANPPAVRISGRITHKRLFGKLTFLKLRDDSGSIQIALSEGGLGDQGYRQWLSLLDVGDILGVEGVPFKTQRGELTIRAANVKILVKALRPMPEKFHGLAETELCYRQRYLDLIGNDQTRARFRARSKIVGAIRDFLLQDDFLEVETPMMQSLPGGAAAKPFVTHHNALGCDLFLRVSPELYLKQLVIGGFEKVFEINRNFRNEGISTQHNPEFTMVEFYEAYSTHERFMDKIEALLRYVAHLVIGDLKFERQGVQYDLSVPFKRLDFLESIRFAFPTELSDDQWEDFEAVTGLLRQQKVSLAHLPTLGHRLLALFEKFVEPNLIQPTFVIGYPASVSPLARRCDEKLDRTDRFELFINGSELANGFSELNNPAQQRMAFEEQAKAKQAGDEEAMPYDLNYVQALEYGLPPTAGAGIGVDRLVMWLTDSSSIKDVILFPTLKRK